MRRTHSTAHTQGLGLGRRQASAAGPNRWQVEMEKEIASRVYESREVENA